MVHDGVSRVPGREKDAQRRPTRGRLSGKLSAANAAGQHHVCEQQVDVALLLLQ